MNKTKIKDIYGENWDLIAKDIKDRAGWKCQECGNENDRKSGHVLTVHHRDGCPRHIEKSNLKADCRKCHLVEQRVLAPCALLMRYQEDMSKTEMNALCHRCKRNRLECKP